MAIQMRRGANKDFDPTKMLPAEMAVTTDGTRKVYAAFAAGDVKELASKEDVQSLIDDFTEVVEDEIAQAQEEIQNEGNKVLATIPDEYEEVAARSVRNERQKAPAIVCELSGAVCVASDSSDDYVRGFKVFGRTEQQTTTGAQLLEFPDVGEFTVSGVTWACKNGGITAKGTSTGISSTIATSIMVDITGTTGTCCISGSENGAGVYARILKADGTIKYEYESAFVLDGTEALVRIYAQVASGVTVDTTIYPMLNAGSTALPWEPYTGGVPSPNPEYPQELVPVGKWGNLLNINAPTKEGYILSLDGTFSENSLYNSYRIESAENLTVSYEKGENFGAFRYGIEVNGVITRYTVSATPVVITQEHDAIWISIYTKEIYQKNIMVNYGTTALPYRPYTGQLEVGVDVLGKNLLENTAVTQTDNGVTFTVNDDGSVTVNGTATSTTLFTINNIRLKANVSYKLSGCPSGGSVNAYRLELRDAHKNTTLFLIDLGSGGEYTPTEDIAVNVLIRISSGYTCNNLTFYPMIRLASITDDTYKPYTHQQLITPVGEGLQGIPLGATIPDIILNSPIHMSGVWWDEVTQQYYIGDTRDWERGVDVQRINHCRALSVNGMDSTGKLFLLQTDRSLRPVLIASSQKSLLCNSFVAKVLEESRNSEYAITHYGISFYIRNTEWNTSDDANAALAEKEVIIQYILETPIETPIPAEEMEAYWALHTNKPTTTVMNDCDAHMQVEYNADTKLYIDNKFAQLAAASI